MRYEIGDYVVVSWKMCRTGSLKVEWKSMQMAREKVGQVVGKKVCFDGTVCHSPVYDEPSWFKPTKRYVFWLVRFGMLNKPIAVSTEGMRLARVDEIVNLPEMYSRRASWSVGDCKGLSEESESFPRDEKGRWAKEMR